MLSRHQIFPIFKKSRKTRKFDVDGVLSSEATWNIVVGGGRDFVSNSYLFPRLCLSNLCLRRFAIFSPAVEAAILTNRAGHQALTRKTIFVVHRTLLGTVRLSVIDHK